MPRKVTVLFIDDETYFATYYVEAAEEAKYEVVYHDTANGGLDYIREFGGQIDLIVLDIMMPTPKGVSAAATNNGLDTGICHHPVQPRSPCFG